MTKLKLELDALLVESFATAPAALERGTVLGNKAVIPASDGAGECGGGSNEESCWTCLSCTAPSDPCICDVTLGC